MTKCKHLIVTFATFGQLLVVALLSLASSTVSLGAEISFSTPVGYPVDKVPAAAAVGDFNSDGNFDIAVANSVSNDVSILLRNADGTFQRVTTVSAPILSPSPLVISMAMGDLIW